MVIDRVCDVTCEKLKIVNAYLDRRREWGVYVFPAMHWLVKDEGLIKKLFLAPSQQPSFYVERTTLKKMHKFMLKMPGIF